MLEGLEQVRFFERNMRNLDKKNCGATAYYTAGLMDEDRTPRVLLLPSISLDTGEK